MYLCHIWGLSILATSPVLLSSRSRLEIIEANRCFFCKKSLDTPPVMVKCCCLKDWFQNLLNPNYIHRRSPEVQVPVQKVEWCHSYGAEKSQFMGFRITVIPIKSNLNCTLQHQKSPWYLHDIIGAQPNSQPTHLAEQRRSVARPTWFPPWPRRDDRCDENGYDHLQWEFQDPKMEVLYHIRPYFVGIFPYIGLIYGI